MVHDTRPRDEFTFGDGLHSNRHWPRTRVWRWPRMIGRADQYLRCHLLLIDLIGGLHFSSVLENDPSWSMFGWDGLFYEWQLSIIVRGKMMIFSGYGCVKPGQSGSKLGPGHHGHQRQGLAWRSVMLCRSSILIDILIIWLIHIYIIYMYVCVYVRAWKNILYIYIYIKHISYI